MALWSGGLAWPIGKVNVKVEPLPTSLATQILPPCSSTNFLMSEAISKRNSSRLSAFGTGSVSATRQLLKGFVLFREFHPVSVEVAGALDATRRLIDMGAVR